MGKLSEQELCEIRARQMESGGVLSPEGLERIASELCAVISDDQLLALLYILDGVERGDERFLEAWAELRLRLEAHQRVN